MPVRLLAIAVVFLAVLLGPRNAVSNEAFRWHLWRYLPVLDGDWVDQIWDYAVALPFISASRGRLVRNEFAGGYPATTPIWIASQNRAPDFAPRTHLLKT